MRFIKKYVNTIMKKYILIFTFFFLSAVILTNLILPRLQYAIARAYFSKNLMTIINSSMVKQSIIWTSNRLEYILSTDQEFHTLINEYYVQNQNSRFIPEIMDFIAKKRCAAVFNWNTSLSAQTEDFVIMDDGINFCNVNQQYLIENIKKSAWYKSLSNDKTNVYSPVITIDNMNKKERYICFALPIEVGNHYGTIMSAINFDDIKIQYNEIEKLGIKDYMMIQKNRIIYQNLKKSQIDITNYPQSMYSTQQYHPVEFVNEDGIDFMVLCSLPFEKFYVAFHIPKETILMPYKDLFTGILVIIYFLLSVILFLFFITMRKITHRLSILGETMKKVQNGYYPVIKKDLNNDEISRLSDSFSVMLKTIRENTEKMLQHEKKEQQTQYALLVSMIDPHYIYNTLNTVTFLANMNRNKDVVKVNNALIATLKDRLQSKNYKTFDSVEIEIQVLKQYMIIQNYLCSNTIKMNLHITETNLHLQIPKNILQPLVENAIKHGILPKKGIDHKPLIGKIDITVYKSCNQKIVLRIADNGIGFDQVKLKKCSSLLNESNVDLFDMKHIGIKNVLMRLIYIYGQDKIKFAINSVKGKGSEFIIIIPDIAKTKK